MKQGQIRYNTVEDRLLATETTRPSPSTHPTAPTHHTTRSQRVYRRGIGKNASRLSEKCHQGSGHDNDKSPPPTASSFRSSKIPKTIFPGAKQKRPPGKDWKRLHGGWGRNCRFVQAKDPRFFILEKIDPAKPLFEFVTDFMEMDFDFTGRGVQKFSRPAND